MDNSCNNNSNNEATNQQRTTLQNDQTQQQQYCHYQHQQQHITSTDQANNYNYHNHNQFIEYHLHQQLQLQQHHQHQQQQLYVQQQHEYTASLLYQQQQAMLISNRFVAPPPHNTTITTSTHITTPSSTLMSPANTRITRPHVNSRSHYFGGKLVLDNKWKNLKKPYTPTITIINCIKGIILCIWISSNFFLLHTNTTPKYTDTSIKFFSQHEEYVPLPSFKKLPSSDSKCRLDKNNKTSETIFAYCESTSCMQHNKDVDGELYISPKSYTSKSGSEGCKMLWFAAMHESDGLCDTSKGEHLYNVDYSVALNSALSNAHDSLQPILLLGRLANENENSTEHKKFGIWAEQKGVKVIYVPRLSFQEDVIRGLPEYFLRKLFSLLQGPFLRLDIPKFINDHNLFDMPNVCKNHVMYTDVDVIFANRFTQYDVQTLVKLTEHASATYGREYKKSAHLIFNTGVMVINVKRFAQDIPSILENARKKIGYPANDQAMLNNYRMAKDVPEHKFKMLPMHYNWKTYWELEPTDFSQLKIIHTHGPKIGSGLEGVAKCDLHDNYRYTLNNIIKQGICCDKGRTAEWTVNAFNRLKAPINDLCDH